MTTFLVIVLVAVCVVGAYYLWYKPLETYRNESDVGGSRPTDADKQDKH
jgi:hypothetical protein